MNGNIKVGHHRLTLKGVLVTVTKTTPQGMLEVTQLDNGKTLTLKPEDTLPLDHKKWSTAPRLDIVTLSKNQVEQMELRSKVVTEYLKLAKPTADDARKAAEQMGIKQARFYVLVKQHTNTNRPLDLVSHLTHRTKGTHKLDAKADEVVREVLDKVNNRFRMVAAIMEIQKTCGQQKLPVPSPATIYRRRAAMPTLKKLAGTIGGRAAHLLAGPCPLHYEDAAFPYHVLEIDHTPLDIVLVDDAGNKIGQVWLTVIIDVCTRMVAGIYLSFDAPSTTSVGAAVIHAVMPKEQYLKDLGLAKYTWPCSGLPDTIHADNGADFRSKMLRMAVENNQMNLIWRAVGTPNQGGHIERLAKRLNDFVKTLKGSIPAGRAARRFEKAEDAAIYSLPQLTQQLVRFIVGDYHATPHSSLKGKSPLEMFQSCVIGSDTQVPTGIRPPPEDLQRLKLDFSPFEMRTVQRQGVRINELSYYERCLDPLILSRNPDSDDGKYLFRTPEADISCIYYWDQPLRTYRQIPACDRLMPAMSKAEWDATRTRLKARDMSPNAANVAEARAEIRAEEEEILQHRAKSASAQRVRRKRAISDAHADARGSTEADSSTTASVPDFDREELEPFKRA